MKRKYLYYKVPGVPGSKGFDLTEQENWESHCMVEKIPCVVVRHRIKLADVEWDFKSSLPASIAFLFSSYNQKLSDDIRSIYQKYADSRSKAHIGRETVLFTNIPIEHSQAAAEELFDVLSAFIAKDINRTAI